MTDHDRGNGRGPIFSIRLTLESDRQLSRLAAEAGISKTRLAAFLLEELLPTVQSVRNRLQITRKPQVPSR